MSTVGSTKNTTVGTSHQLFHQLRPAERGALRDSVLEFNLGHFDHLLGNNMQRHVDDLQDVHQLVHHMRHRNIEDLHQEHEILDLFRCAPLLRPRRLCQAGRPRPPLGVFLIAGGAAFCCALWCICIAVAAAIVANMSASSAMFDAEQLQNSGIAR